MNRTSLNRALVGLKAGDSVLVDVREPGEYREGTLEGAINIPSRNFSVESYLPYKNHKIILLCQSGNRVKGVYETLQNHGFTNVSILEEHMAQISQVRVVSRSKGWTIDRQFRMTLGILLVIFLTGFYFLSSAFIVIPVILATGLVVTSIIDRCYMRMGIAMLPWNRGKKI